MDESIKTRARRGRPPGRKPKQRTMLLDAVTRQINTEGAGSIVLADLCKRLNLSRSSLYYYCRDANDLVFQAYMQACRTLADDIDWAEGLAGPADKKLTAFIRRVLAYDHGQIAALNDIDILPSDLKAQVNDAADDNRRRLAALLEVGQREGIFRPFDASLTACLILNAISWALVSLPWLNRRDDETGRTGYTDALCDILINGIAGKKTDMPVCDIVFERLISQPFNAFDRNQTAEIKATQIIAAASRLFNLRGLDGVRLDDVSAEIGASKGAIYHHFRDKPDLIERCYDRAFDLYDLMMETGIKAGTTPLERAYIVTHLNAQAQLSANPPLALQPGLGKLDGEKRREFAQRAHALGDAGMRNQEEGVISGYMRPLPNEHVSEILAGYFLGLPRLTPVGASPRAMADFITDIALYGLRTDRDLGTRP